MSKYLWLIRHGQSQGNFERRIQGWADYPLTEMGRLQATRLAERLAEERPIHEVVASPLQRAAGTAEIIARALALPVRFDVRLKEYNFGPLNGLTTDEIVARFPTVRAAWERNQPWQSLPGEEGELAFSRRVRAAMDEIVAKMDEDTATAVVAHGGSLNVCLRSWLRIDGRQRQRGFAFDNASVSLVRIQGDNYRILLLNDTCHLKCIQEDLFPKSLQG